MLRNGLVKDLKRFAERGALFIHAHWYVPSDEAGQRNEWSFPTEYPGQGHAADNRFT
jgi:hypothetical protein